ncbi:hypothetical protein [Alkaliphilus transvaalensis]|uniref:hypothetical protein n=1 Tax=Alkaliphilus transvaalensis TaxID=114628 RepID=UPI00047EFD91|nr:hypothetical protein [Alkaliphilus transvaalensis]
MQSILNEIKKILKLSISSILILSIFPVIYSLIKKGNLIKRIFDFNYIIASIIVLYGIFTLFVPINLKKSNRLVDHSNYGEVMKDEKDKKFSGVVESLLWGISNLLIVGIIEILVHGLL